MSSDDAKARYFARTMHTPDDEERAAIRATLRETSKALLPMHRAMIDAAKEQYSLSVAPIQGPNHLLQLLQEDPFFEWLKPVTTLIVTIDDMARRDFTVSEAATIGDQLDQLFGTGPGGNEAFSERYLPLLQREFDITVGHAVIRKSIEKLKG